MKTLVTFLVLMGCLTAQSAEPLTIECTKGSDKLVFQINAGNFPGGGSSFYDMKLNGKLGSFDGYDTFNQILKASRKCEDLKGYIAIPQFEVLLCSGAMIVPNGIYGQVILSANGIDVFTRTLAPAAGWKCN